MRGSRTCTTTNRWALWLSRDEQIATINNLSSLCWLKASYRSSCGGHLHRRTRPNRLRISPLVFLRFAAISFRIVPILAGTIIAGTRNDIRHRYAFHLTKDIYLTTRKSRDSRQSVGRLSLSILSATSRNLVAQRGSRETRRKWSRRALNLVNYQRRAREILLQAPRRYESN